MKFYKYFMHEIAYHCYAWCRKALDCLWLIRLVAESRWLIAEELMRDRHRLHEESLIPSYGLVGGWTYVSAREFPAERLPDTGAFVEHSRPRQPPDLRRPIRIRTRHGRQFNDAGTSLSAAADCNVVTRTGLTGERPVEVDIVFTLGHVRPRRTPRTGSRHAFERFRYPKHSRPHTLGWGATSAECGTIVAVYCLNDGSCLAAEGAHCQIFQVY